MTACLGSYVRAHRLQCAGFRGPTSLSLCHLVIYSNCISRHLIHVASNAIRQAFPTLSTEKKGALMMMMMIILRALLGSATASVLQTPIPDRVLAVQGRTCRTRCLPITGEKIVWCFSFCCCSFFPRQANTCSNRRISWLQQNAQEICAKSRVRLFPVTSWKASSEQRGSHTVLVSRFCDVPDMIATETDMKESMK